MAAELVRLKVDVIVVYGSPAIHAVKKATSTIPIVFTVNADPVGAGYVASLAGPGGNVTGLSDFHSGLVAKRLQLLKEVVPSASRVAVLFNPTTPVLSLQWGRPLGCRVQSYCLEKVTRHWSVFARRGVEPRAPADWRLALLVPRPLTATVRRSLESVVREERASTRNTTGWRRSTPA
jgi:hypothetical protein